MNRPLCWTLAATALVVIGTTSARADHRVRYQSQYACPCPQTTQAATPAPEAAPPAAPANGVTQQNRSVQPQATTMAPPVPARTGTTYRSYSVAPRASGSNVPADAPMYNPSRRLRPSNRLMGGRF